MERAVHVRPGIGNHLHFGDLELGSVVDRPRFLAAPPITNDRRGQSLIGDHAVFDDVADIDES